MGGGANLPNQSQDSSSSSSSPLDLLILGAGWTSTFLIPLLKQKSLKYAATTTSGRDGTYKFGYNPDDVEGNKRQLKELPTAKSILITFPLKGTGQSREIVTGYLDTHSLPSNNLDLDPDAENVEGNGKTNETSSFQFIQLGSSGIFTIPGQEIWVTRLSSYDTSDLRAVAEDELMELGGCVLNLSGLWGGERDPKHWVERVAPTKEVLAGKGSLHMVHGVDVARGVVGVMGNWGKAGGERWLLTDLQVYDWWSLILGYAGEIDSETGDAKMEGRQIKWVGELMREGGVRALPRSMEVLGRCYDTREFWDMVGVMPVRSRV